MLTAFFRPKTIIFVSYGAIKVFSAILDSFCFYFGIEQLPIFISFLFVINRVSLEILSYKCIVCYFSECVPLCLLILRILAASYFIQIHHLLFIFKLQEQVKLLFKFVYQCSIIQWNKIYESYTFGTINYDCLKLLC